MSLTPPSSISHTYAAGTPTIASLDEVVFNIPQGQTTDTVEYVFPISNYTDGFNLQAQIDSFNSDVLAGVSLQIDGVVILEDADSIVRQYHDTVPDTLPLSIAATVPADAPIGSDYATFVFAYDALDIDYYYTFQDPAVLGWSDPASPNYDPSAVHFTSNVCDTGMEIYGTGGPLDDTVLVTDTRDKQDYRVRKLSTVYSGAGGLPDTTQGGKCWVIDNLKLNLHGLTLTDADTALTSVPSVGPINTKANSTSKTYSGDFQTSGAMTVNGAVGTGSPNQDFWAQANPALSGGSAIWCNTASSIPPGSTTGCGYLYNFYTATAGTTPGNATGGTVARDSICPAGWHLPNRGAVGADFNTLDTAYGGNGGYAGSGSVVYAALWRWTDADPTGAFEGLWAGNYTVAAFTASGAGGYWWSSNVSSAASAYYALVGATGVYPGTNDMSKYIGYAVRCVLG